MIADPNSPGILTSRSELLVSDPSRRGEVLRVLQDLFAEFIQSHPNLIDAKAAEADFDAATILLHLEITGTSFVQADTVSRTLIESLSEHINNRPVTGQKVHSPAVQQVSQTLVPA